MQREKIAKEKSNEPNLFRWNKTILRNGPIGQIDGSSLGK